MKSVLLHVYGADLVGAVVCNLTTDRVLATSPSLRFMEGWTVNQVNVYVNTKHWRCKWEVLETEDSEDAQDAARREGQPQA